MSELIDLCRKIAKEAHAGQKRWNGDDYFTAHVEKVAASVARTIAGDDFQAIALLHDVIEDSEWTTAMLVAAGVPISVVAAVEVITKMDIEDYADYIQRIRGNYDASVVKRADLRQNISCCDPVKHKNQITKYKLALMVLGG